MKKEVAFSGLEAAIVLIAFVVVAAVFSYVMLGAGFFATQKSQEVTYSGIKQATSNMVVSGQLYGITSSGAAGGGLSSITFYLTIPEGGQPQSLKYTNLRFKWTVSSVLDDKIYGPISIKNTPWPNTILRPGETKEFTLTVPKGLPGTLVRPRPGDSFTLEVLPDVGAASLVSKTLVTGYGGGVII
jgi:flagellin FlaB